MTKSKWNDYCVVCGRWGKDNYQLFDLCIKYLDLVEMDRKQYQAGGQWCCHTPTFTVDKVWGKVVWPHSNKLAEEKVASSYPDIHVLEESGLPKHHFT